MLDLGKMLKLYAVLCLTLYCSGIEVVNNNINHLVKGSLLICRSELDVCTEDVDCRNCMVGFDPKFSIYSLDGCEQLQHDMNASMSTDCNTTSIKLKDLETCIEDEVFYILTLKTVKHMCSDQY